MKALFAHSRTTELRMLRSQSSLVKQGVVKSVVKQRQRTEPAPAFRPREPQRLVISRAEMGGNDRLTDDSVGPTGEGWNFFQSMCTTLADKLINQCWSGGEIGVLGDILGPQHVYKDSCWTTIDLVGRRALSNFIQDFRVAYPDLNFEVKEVMSRGYTGLPRGEGVVMVYWEGQGTQIGEFLGAPATGRVETFSGVSVLHVDLKTARIRRTEVFRECSLTESRYKSQVNWSDEDY